MAVARVEGQTLDRCRQVDAEIGDLAVKNAPLLICYSTTLAGLDMEVESQVLFGIRVIVCGCFLPVLKCKIYLFV